MSTPIKFDSWENVLPFGRVDISSKKAMIIKRNGSSARIVTHDGVRYNEPTIENLGEYHKQVADRLVTMLNLEALKGFDNLTAGHKAGLKMWRKELYAGKEFRPDWYEFVVLCDRKEVAA